MMSFHSFIRVVLLFSQIEIIISLDKQPLLNKEEVYSPYTTPYTPQQIAERISQAQQKKSEKFRSIQPPAIETCESLETSDFEQFVCEITVHVRKMFPNETNPYTILELCASMAMLNDPAHNYPCAGDPIMPSISDFQFARIVYTPQGHIGPPVVAYAHVKSNNLDIVRFNGSWFGDSSDVHFGDVSKEPTSVTLAYDIYESFLNTKESKKLIYRFPQLPCTTEPVYIIQHPEHMGHDGSQYQNYFIGAKSSHLCFSSHTNKTDINPMCSLSENRPRCLNYSPDYHRNILTNIESNMLDANISNISYSNSQQDQKPETTVTSIQDVPSSLIKMYANITNETITYTSKGGDERDTYSPPAVPRGSYRTYQQRKDMFKDAFHSLNRDENSRGRTGIRSQGYFSGSDIENLNQNLTDSNWETKLLQYPGSLSMSRQKLDSVTSRSPSNVGSPGYHQMKQLLRPRSHMKNTFSSPTNGIAVDNGSVTQTVPQQIAAALRWVFCCGCCGNNSQTKPKND